MLVSARVGCVQVGMSADCWLCVACNKLSVGDSEGRMAICWRSAQDACYDYGVLTSGNDLLHLEMDMRVQRLLARVETIPEQCA